MVRRFTENTGAIQSRKSGLIVHENPQLYIGFFACLATSSTEGPRPMGSSLGLRGSDVGAFRENGNAANH